MIWFFERGSEVLRVETRVDANTGEYVAVLHQADNSETTRRFKDAESFGAYLRTVEQRLAEEHWEARGPQVQRGGWFKAALPAH